VINRRSLLVLTAAGVAAGCSSPKRNPPPSTAPAPPVDVKFQPAQTEVDIGGPILHSWAYTDRLPGNEIRIRKGGRLRATVTNKLPADTSIHWHGIAIVNNMDGVPPLTQPPIPAAGQFTYDFAGCTAR
jgi:FtsP/CotA-like multicopper oxidase with cupredoxin domain